MIKLLTQLNSRLWLVFFLLMGMTLAETSETRTIRVGMAEIDALPLRQAVFVPLLELGNIAVSESFLPFISHNLSSSPNQLWDVVVVNRDVLINECHAAGQLNVIDWLNIPHRDLLLNAAARETCGIGYAIMGTVLAYSITHQYGTPPSTWEDVFDLARYPGKRAFPRQGRNVLEIALLADGVKPDVLYTVLATEEGQTRALEKLSSIESEIIWYDDHYLLQEWLMNGEVALAVGMDGFLLHGEGRDNLAISREQMIYRMRYLAIPKNSQDKDVAYIFLSVATQAAQQQAMAKMFPYGLVLKQAELLLPAEDLKFLTTYPQNLREGIVEDYDFYAQFGDKIEQIFQQWLQKHSPATKALHSVTKIWASDRKDFVGPRPYTMTEGLSTDSQNGDISDSPSDESTPIVQ